MSSLWSTSPLVATMALSSPESPASGARSTPLSWTQIRAAPPDCQSPMVNPRLSSGSPSLLPTSPEQLTEILRQTRKGKIKYNRSQSGLIEPAENQHVTSFVQHTQAQVQGHAQVTLFKYRWL